MGGTTFIPFTREPPTNYNKEKMARAEAKKAATGGAETAGAPAPTPAPAPKPVAKPVPAPAPAPAAAKPKPVASAPKVAPAAASGGDGLAALDAKLLHQSYVDGFTPSKADATEFGKLSTVDESKYPNVARWHRHIASFTAAQRAAFA
jgi:glutathione S-transferase